jgi:hypothetical protein
MAAAVVNVVVAIAVVALAALVVAAADEVRAGSVMTLSAIKTAVSPRKSFLSIALPKL